MGPRDVPQGHAPFLEHNLDRCFVVFAYDHPYPIPRALHTPVGTPQRLLDRGVFVDVAAITTRGCHPFLNHPFLSARCGGGNGRGSRDIVHEVIPKLENG